MMNQMKVMMDQVLMMIIQENEKNQRSQKINREGKNCMNQVSRMMMIGMIQPLMNEALAMKVLMFYQ